MGPKQKFAIGDRIRFLIDYVPLRDSRREPYRRGPHDKRYSPIKGQIGVIEDLSANQTHATDYDLLISFKHDGNRSEWWYGFEHIEPERFEMLQPDFTLDEIEAGSKILEDLS
jgi:hypothetical protein